jgi:hypothetical protein
MSEVNPEDFLKVVQSKYEQNPYGISGFAFWKVEEQIHRAVTIRLRILTIMNVYMRLLTGNLFSIGQKMQNHF